MIGSRTEEEVLSLIKRTQNKTIKQQLKSELEYIRLQKKASDPDYKFPNFSNQNSDGGSIIGAILGGLIGLAIGAIPGGIAALPGAVVGAYLGWKGDLFSIFPIALVIFLVLALIILFHH